MRNRYAPLEQGKRRAQTIAALLFAAVMCILSAGMAFAESEADRGPETESETESETLDLSYAGYLGEAVNAAAIMESRAIRDEVVFAEDGEVWDFRTVETGSPKMALLFFPTEKQRAELADSFGASGTGIVKPVSDEVNRRYSKNYARLAEGLYQEGECDPAVEKGAEEIPMVVVLLFYNRHMTITVFEDGKYASEFLMSDETVLQTVDEDYLSKEVSSLGVTGECNQIIYDESQLGALLREWGREQ